MSNKYHFCLVLSIYFSQKNVVFAVMSANIK